jgi:hypothetical protein
LTVELTIQGVELRHAWVKHRLRGETVDGWEPPEPKLPSSNRRFSTWNERYSAAWLCALALLDENWDDTRRRERAAIAVGHLESAMAAATSWYVASRRDWVLSEDPDLRGLRETKAFKHFETIHFPSAFATPQRPKDLSRWEHCGYAADLIAETARRWEHVWQRRRDEPAVTIEPDGLVECCRDEMRAWTLVHGVTSDYRHWPLRLELIAKMERWSGKYGFAPLDVSVPRFESRREAIVTDTEAEIRHHETRLRQISDEIGAHVHHSPELELLYTRLHDGEIAGLATRSTYLPRASDLHVSLWHNLYEWIRETPSAAASSARLRFRESAVWLLPSPRSCDGTDTHHDVLNALSQVDP